MTHAEDGVRLVTLSGYTSGLLGRLYGLCREMRGGRKVAIRMVDDKAKKDRDGRGEWSRWSAPVSLTEIGSVELFIMPLRL